MRFELGGKTALVTGAGSGIGRGVAEVLAGRGMKLVLADINEESLADTVASLNAAGATAIAARLDIRDAAAWEALLDRAEQQLGPVQLLCNVAGVTAAPGPLLDMPSQAWHWVIETNLNGTYNGVMAVARRLKAQHLPGHIVNTSSTQGLFGAPGFAAYNASKAAVASLAASMAIELAPHGIRVNAVAPGTIATDITRPMIAAGHRFGGIPLGRIGDAREVAWAIAFLAGDEASYVTGTTLVVDGGQLAINGEPLPPAATRSESSPRRP